MDTGDKKDNINTTKKTDEKADLLMSSNQNLVRRAPSLSYALKKIEKLAAATHLVTSFIPNSESHPLSKWTSSVLSPYFFARKAT